MLEEEIQFTPYMPQKLREGPPHPDLVVQASSLASVEPPDITYALNLPKKVYTEARLSRLQLESIVYACQAHDGRPFQDGRRRGFLIGDGAGVGKGRQLAGLIMENWRRGRKKHVWLSISADLADDAARDFRDLGEEEDSRIKILELRKLDYKPIREKEGVLFSTYASLIAKNARRTRFDQVIDWLGGDEFDGCICLDECHKAKNAFSETAASKTGEAVVRLQERLPNARVVYCSATGASEPANMAYMSRLGIWGVGRQNTFEHFTDFLSAMKERGVGAMELLAMELKKEGLFTARTLSYKDCSFEVITHQIPPEQQATYNGATRFWQALYHEILDAMKCGEHPALLYRSNDGEHAAEEDGIIADEAEDESDVRGAHHLKDPNGTTILRSRNVLMQYWGAHQRFFRSLTVGLKVPGVIAEAKRALNSQTPKCVVIGLQQTGEAGNVATLKDKKDVPLEGLSSAAKYGLVKVIHTCLPAFYPADEEPPQASKRHSFDVRAVKCADDGSEGSDFDWDEDLYRKPALACVEPAHKAGEPLALSAQKEQKKEDETPPTLMSFSKATEDWDNFYLPPFAPVKDQRFVSMRRRAAKFKRMVEELSLPPNPLDVLIDELGGTSNVAEMTGRSMRVVRDEITNVIAYNKRNDFGEPMEEINIIERKRFSDGHKNVAIISDAASAGISLHADRRLKNQKRRVHITMELPWSADKTIQQLGRTHRSNQTSGPEYKMIITSVGGERRFAAAVARRLESLGALSQGDRRATVGAQGMGLSAFNLDNEHGRHTLNQIYHYLWSPNGQPLVPDPGVSAVLQDELRSNFASQSETCILIAKGLQDDGEDDIPHGLMDSYEASEQVTFRGLALSWLREVGIDLLNADAKKGRLVAKAGGVSMFLNRILGLALKKQDILFSYFTASLERAILRALQDGTTDRGVKTLGGRSLGFDENPKAIYKDADGELIHHVLKQDLGIEWEIALSKFRNAVRRQAIEEMEMRETDSMLRLDELKQYRYANGFWKCPSGERVFLAIQRATIGSKSAGGNVAVNTYSPESGTGTMYVSKLLQFYVKVLDEGEARAMWEAQFNRSVERGTRIKEIHFLSGSIFSLWDVMYRCLPDEQGQQKKCLTVARAKQVNPENQLNEEIQATLKLDEVESAHLDLDLGTSLQGKNGSGSGVEVQNVIAGPPYVSCTCHYHPLKEKRAPADGVDGYHVKCDLCDALLDGLLRFVCAKGCKKLDICQQCVREHSRARLGKEAGGAGLAGGPEVAGVAATSAFVRHRKRKRASTEDPLDSAIHAGHEDPDRSGRDLQGPVEHAEEGSNSDDEGEIEFEWSGSDQARASGQSATSRSVGSRSLVRKRPPGQTAFFTGKRNHGSVVARNALDTRFLFRDNPIRSMMNSGSAREIGGAEPEAANAKQKEMIGVLLDKRPEFMIERIKERCAQRSAQRRQAEENRNELSNLLQKEALMGMGAADFGGAFAAAAALMQRATALAHSAHYLEGSQKTDAQQPASLAFQTFASALNQVQPGAFRQQQQRDAAKGGQSDGTGDAPPVVDRKPKIAK